MFPSGVISQVSGTIDSKVAPTILDAFSPDSFSQKNAQKIMSKGHRLKYFYFLDLFFHQLLSNANASHN